MSEMNELITLAEAAIEKYGPLDFETLKYFLKQRTKTYIMDTDLEEILNYAEYKKRIIASHIANGKYNSRYYLADKPDAAITTPKDFIKAYFILLEKNKIMMENPEYVNAPIEWFKEVFTSQHEGWLSEEPDV